MEYSLEDIQRKVSRFGEANVVLDSGREYQIHGNEQFRVANDDTDEFETEVHIEGVDGDGEYVVVEFHPSAVEHVWTHREV